MIEAATIDDRLRAKILKWMNLKKNVHFKIGSEDWDMPLGVLLLLLGITVLFVFGGIYIGYKFGNSQF